MFHKAVEKMSTEEMKARLKSVVIDRILLQRSCEMAGFPHMRPEKFSKLSLTEAQSKIGKLNEEIRRLVFMIDLDDVVNTVFQSATKEAAVQLEAKVGAPPFSGMIRK